MQLTRTFITSSGLITYMPLPLDNRVLLCIPNLMAGGSDNTQFMTGSSGCMTIWQPMLIIQSLLRHSSRPSVVFQKESSYQQRMVGFAPKS